jgi:hypothetical protein
VRFLTKVQVTNDGVLEEVDRCEAKNAIEHRGISERANARRNELQENESENESGSECQESFLNAARPRFLEVDKAPAKHFRGGSSKTKQKHLSRH